VTYDEGLCLAAIENLRADGLDQHAAVFQSAVDEAQRLRRECARSQTWIVEALEQFRTLQRRPWMDDSPASKMG
jgi:hypothetical protein